MTETITVVIQIGNSDNNLTQGEWANFAASMHQTISHCVFRIHFKGGSDWDAPWQNACWVCEVAREAVDKLKREVEACRKNYRQDSASMTFGETVFI